MTVDMTALSLFAGIEGFGCALEQNGVPVKASVEIDADARSVIALHFPDSVLLGDVTKVTAREILAAGFVPYRGILCGGFPCQDLSVAGLRRGLGGARSGLFWEIVRLARALRPRWLILENVPGLLSAVCHCPGDDTCTDNGRTVPGACGEWRVVSRNPDVSRWFPNVPHGVPGGACATGCMAAHGGAMGTVIGALGELGYGVAYRVLDSQFFGVAQRRERVFIVGCLGDWAAPAEVLLEPQSGEGNPAAGGAAGEGAAGPAAGSAGGTGTAAPLTTRPYADQISAEDSLITASTLQGGGRRGHRVDAEGAAGGHLIPFDTARITSGANRSNPHAGKVSRTITSHHGKGPDSDATNGLILAPAGPAFPRSDRLVAQAVTAREGKGADSDATSGNLIPMVAHALTSEGATASEDGTGRGTPLVTVPRPAPPDPQGMRATPRLPRRLDPLEAHRRRAHRAVRLGALPADRQRRHHARPGLDRPPDRGLRGIAGPAS